MLQRFKDTEGLQLDLRLYVVLGGSSNAFFAMSKFFGNSEEGMDLCYNGAGQSASGIMEGAYSVGLTNIRALAEDTDGDCRNILIPSASKLEKLHITDAEHARIHHDDFLQFLEKCPKMKDLSLGNLVQNEYNIKTSKTASFIRQIVMNSDLERFSFGYCYSTAREDDGVLQALGEAIASKNRIMEIAITGDIPRWFCGTTFLPVLANIHLLKSLHWVFLRKAGDDRLLLDALPRAVNLQQLGVRTSWRIWGDIENHDPRIENLRRVCRERDILLQVRGRETVE